MSVQLTCLTADIRPAGHAQGFQFRRSVENNCETLPPNDKVRVDLRWYSCRVPVPVLFPEGHAGRSRVTNRLLRLRPNVRSLRLAVFHRSEDVQEHIAPLRQVKGLEVLLVWQGVTWMLPRGVAGVLWELAPEDAADSRIRELIGGVPSASYSLASNPALARRFAHHWIPPTSLDARSPGGRRARA